MTLTDAEREKFAAYCDAQAATAKALIDQMTVLKAPAGLLYTYTANGAAYSLVAADLRRAESQSIG